MTSIVFRYCTLLIVLISVAESHDRISRHRESRTDRQVDKLAGACYAQQKWRTCKTNCDRQRKLKQCIKDLANIACETVISPLDLSTQAQVIDALILLVSEHT